jgi:uroporphyrinogen decarboxylase
MMFQSRAVFDYLMKKLTKTVISYLSSQIIAGAQAVQIFDSWAGVLAPDDYKEFELPYVKKIISNLKKQHPETPVIYFANNCAGIIKEVKKSGADVIGIDWRIDIADAIKRLGKKVAVQGNIDPCALFLPEEEIGKKVQDILLKGKSAKGHIFNLGHGILPETPVKNAIAAVEAVHKYSRK